MARLIDFHGNCACGRDAHVTGQLDDEGYLRVQLETSGGRCGQTADAGAHLGEAMAQLRGAELDADAVNAAADAAADDDADDEPVATQASATQAPASAKRGRPARQGGGG